MTKNEGGAAFACASENGHQPGMSLRDWFAGMALQGYCSDRVTLMGFQKPSDAAAMAYQFADAMIEGRDISDNKEEMR